MIGQLIPEGAAPGAARLNLEATLQIARNRELTARRRGDNSFAGALIDGGFDYTPGVGFHQPPANGHLQKPPYMGLLKCMCRGCMPDDRDRRGRVLVPKTFDPSLVV